MNLHGNFYRSHWRCCRPVCSRGSPPKTPGSIKHQISRSDMTEIAAIHAREILDSRGNPTVEADVVLAEGGDRTRSGAQRRIDRRARGRRTARQRQEALSRQRRAAGRGKCRKRDSAGAHGHGRDQSAPARCHDARAGWHAEQGPPRSECDSGGFDGGGARLGELAAHAALPLSRRSERIAAADAR